MNNTNILEIKVINSYDKDNIFDYYSLLKDNGRLDVFMHEDNSLQCFLDFCYKQWIYVCVLNGEDVGFTVFNCFQGKSAFFHFVMFNGGEPFTVDFGKMIFDSVFRNDDLKTVFGLTPQCYRHVFPIVHGVGLKKIVEIEQVCKVKGKLRTGVYSVITKNDFYSDTGNCIS